MGLRCCHQGKGSQYPAIFDLDVWENELKLQQFTAAGEIREKSNTAGRSKTTTTLAAAALALFLHCPATDCIPGVDRGVFDVVTGVEEAAGNGNGINVVSSNMTVWPLLALFFSLVPRMICRMVSLTLEASLPVCPEALCLLCFMRRF